VQQFQPANRDVEKQLEQQMEAERNRRKQLLDTQAAVNVAEGMKQRTILNSEVRRVSSMCLSLDSPDVDVGRATGQDQPGASTD
jgi:regulator of protease activity HflC (stomatin/prohibitin superfamily)